MVNKLTFKDMADKLEFKGVKSTTHNVDGIGSYGESYSATKILNSGAEKETFAVLRLDNYEYVKPKDSSGKQDPSGKDTFDCTFGFAPNEYSRPNKEIFKIEGLKVMNIEPGYDSTGSYVVAIEPVQWDVKVGFSHVDTDYLSFLMNDHLDLFAQ